MTDEVDEEGFRNRTNTNTFNFQHSQNPTNFAQEKIDKLSKQAGKGTSKGYREAFRSATFGQSSDEEVIFDAKKLTNKKF